MAERKEPCRPTPCKPSSWRRESWHWWVTSRPTTQQLGALARGGGGGEDEGGGDPQARGVEGGPRGEKPRVSSSCRRVPRSPWIPRPLCKDDVGSIGVAKDVGLRCRVDVAVDEEGAAKDNNLVLMRVGSRCVWTERCIAVPG